MQSGTGLGTARPMTLRDVSLDLGAMARQAEAEREKRAKMIAAEGEALAAGELAHASDVMMAHPLALQLRNLQTLVEISVDKNSTVVFPAPLMSTIVELGGFLSRETAAVGALPKTPVVPAARDGEPRAARPSARRAAGPAPRSAWSSLARVRSATDATRDRAAR